MKRLIFFFSIILFLISCSSNDFDIDVSGIKTDLKIIRFEQELSKFNRDSAGFYISKFENEYPSFFKLYNLQIIAIGESNTRRYADSLYYFLKYCKDEKIEKAVSDKFLDITLLSEQLDDAFKHYKYYFPTKPIPDIYTCISGFNQSVFTTDSLIGISLDKYLGYDSEFYERLSFYDYHKRRMYPEMIPVDVTEAWAKAEFVYKGESDDMLDNMLYGGKIQYFINCMLPNIPDTVKWRYTKKQLDWANANENNIWNYMTQEKLLFSTKPSEIVKYTGEGPFTVPFSKKSAPRAAVFVAYKIVKSYMDNNTDISLKTLMEENDSRKILSKAKYNPE